MVPMPKTIDAEISCEDGTVRRRPIKTVNRQFVVVEHQCQWDCDSLILMEQRSIDNGNPTERTIAHTMATNVEEKFLLFENIFWHCFCHFNCLFMSAGRLFFFSLAFSCLRNLCHLFIFIFVEGAELWSRDMNSLSSHRHNRYRFTLYRLFHSLSIFINHNQREIDRE